MQAVPAGGGALPPALPSARAAFKRASFPTPPARAARPRAPIGSALRSALILLARSAPRPAPAHRLAVPPRRAGAGGRAAMALLLQLLRRLLAHLGQVRGGGGRGRGGA